MNEQNKVVILYNIDDKPPAGKSILFALQHILAMFAANVTVPIIVIGIAKLTPGQGVFLIQCSLLMAGIVTLIQVIGINKVGSKLPIVMGTSNAFLSTISTIVSQYGIGAALGASFIGGLFETFLGNYVGKVRKIFTPLITSIVVITIGMTLIPVGIKQAAGSKSQLGAPINLLLSGFVIFIIVLCHRAKNKTVKSSSILIGIVAGYILAIALGKVDFTPVLDASWFSIPKPFQYKWEFPWPAIVAMLFMYLATSIETLGDMAALTVIAQNRQPTTKEMTGGIMADGLGSSLAAMFNAFPNTSYTQNIGVVNLTGVFSRSIVTIGAIILIVMSLFPKISAIISCVPEPVLGGASLITFVMVLVSGMAMLKDVELGSRNMMIMAVSLGIGVGCNLVPEAVSYFPSSIAVCLESGVVPAGILAMLLDFFLPKE